jgi:two-component system cell cycle response regulator
MVKAKILIIDDEIFFLDMLYDLLYKKGYEVSKFQNIEESLEALGKDNYDLIFIDATLKNISGTAGIKKIKELQSVTDIVVTTSLDDTSLVPEFLKDGATDFILKPYKGEELEMLADRLLKRKDMEKDRDILLYENLEFVELLSLYRRIIRLVTEWEIEKLKEMLLDEIMSSTFGQGALFYGSANPEDPDFSCDVYRGIVDLGKIKTKISKAALDNPEMSFYFNPKELNIVLRLGDRNYGFIKVVEPLLQEGFTEKEFNKAYLICEFMSYALENAKRVEMLQRCTVKDERTQAYHWDIFRDFVKKEIYKALRYDRKLSILRIRAENMPDLKKKYKDDVIQAALTELSDTVHNVIRDSDWLVQKKPEEFLIFLTETDYFGAVMTIRRIRQAMVGKGIIKGARSVDELLLNVCAVGLPIHGTNLDDLFKNLENRLDLSRNSIYYRLDFNKRDFAQLCEDVILLKDGGIDKGSVFYSWTKKGKIQYREIVGMIANDVKLSSKRRGVMYAGLFDGKEMDFIEDKDGFVDISTKIYFFLKENKEHFDVPGVISVGVEKVSYHDFKFVLYLNEHYSYGFIESGHDIFESCDSMLIEALINKLQTEYYLQWQL